MNRVQRELLLWSSLLTAVTGAIYWWMDAMLEPVGEWAVVNHPLQPWVLKAHIVVAPVLVFAIGLITMDHIWKHVRTGVRRGRRSGLASMWLAAPMVITGYLVQVTTHEGWLAVVAWAHIVTGAAFAAGVLGHWWMVGRSGTGSGARTPATRSRVPEGDGRIDADGAARRQPARERRDREDEPGSRRQHERIRGRDSEEEALDDPAPEHRAS